MNFSSLMSRVRVLPMVLVVGTVVLVLKGNNVVMAAAEGISNAVAEANAPHKDFALDDEEQTSAAEVDVLTSLSKRRLELEGRATDMTMRQNVLAATEKRVDEKIAKLQSLQAEMDKLLAKRDAEQQKQVDSLVKIYAAMKPANAARIFNNLSDDVLIPVAGQMKADALAPILSAMNPDAAQKLTVKLANKLNVPEKAEPAPAAPIDPLLPPPGAPQPMTSNEAQPLEQQAALTPPPAPAQPAAQPAPAKPAPVAPKLQAHKEAPAKPPVPAATKPAPQKTASTTAPPTAQKPAATPPAATTPAAPAPAPKTAH